MQAEYNIEERLDEIQSDLLAMFKPDLKSLELRFKNENATIEIAASKFWRGKDSHKISLTKSEFGRLHATKAYYSFDDGRLKADAQSNNDTRAELSNEVHEVMHALRHEILPLMKTPIDAYKLFNLRQTEGSNMISAEPETQEVFEGFIASLNYLSLMFASAIKNPAVTNLIPEAIKGVNAKGFELHKRMDAIEKGLPITLRIRELDKQIKKAESERENNNRKLEAHENKIMEDLRFINDLMENTDENHGVLNAMLESKKVALEGQLRGVNSPTYNDIREENAQLNDTITQLGHAKRELNARILALLAAPKRMKQTLEEKTRRYSNPLDPNEEEGVYFFVKESTPRRTSITLHDPQDIVSLLNMDESPSTPPQSPNAHRRPALGSPHQK